jgi:hypothetical protein
MKNMYHRKEHMVENDHNLYFQIWKWRVSKFTSYKWFMNAPWQAHLDAQNIIYVMLEYAICLYLAMLILNIRQENWKLAKLITCFYFRV